MRLGLLHICVICCTCISAYIVFRLACTGGSRAFSPVVARFLVINFLLVFKYIMKYMYTYTYTYTDLAETTPTTAWCALNRKTGRAIICIMCIKDQRKSLKDPNKPSCYFTACNQPDLPTESFQILKLDRG